MAFEPTSFSRFPLKPYLNCIKNIIIGSRYSVYLNRSATVYNTIRDFYDIQRKHTSAA